MSNGNTNAGKAQEISFTAKLNATPQAVAETLQQLAANPEALGTLQFTIRVEQPAQAEAGNPPAYVAMRQVFTDPQDNTAKVRITFLADGLKEEAVIDVRAVDIGEKSDWERLLGNPIVDIDTGITIIRLIDDTHNGAAVWMPNNGNIAEIITAVIVPMVPPGGTDSNLAAFLKCMKQQKALRKTYAQSLCECLHQL